MEQEHAKDEADAALATVADEIGEGLRSGLAVRSEADCAAAEGTSGDGVIA